jgi:hypothetical protein
MKKLFMTLGVIFLCIIVIGIIGFSIAAYHGTKLDKSSKAYVDKIAPLIISSWNSKELVNRASPELLKAVPQDKWNAMFKMFSKKLEALKEYKGSKGDSFMNFSPVGKVITAIYIAQATFEKGNAEIKISIIQHNEKWQLLGFYVNSPALMP